MTRSRYFDIDPKTVEGQAEILAAWSIAELDIAGAAWYLKLTHAEFRALAADRGVSAPSPEAIARRDAELEAYFRPKARRDERDRVRKNLLEITEMLDEDAQRLSLVINWSDTTSLQTSKNSSMLALREIGHSKEALNTAAILLAESAAADHASDERDNRGEPQMGKNPK